MSKLTIQDLITIGVFTAIYFVLLTICTFTSFMLVPGISFILLPVFASFLCAIAYMLLVARVQKFGAITILGTVIGIFFLVSGHFFTSFITCILCGVLADYIASIKKYKSFFFTLLSYIVFSFAITGPVLPMWLFKAQYVEHLTNTGKSVSNIAERFTYINWTSLLIFVIAMILLATLGALFSRKLLKKHFEKAGVI